MFRGDDKSAYFRLKALDRHVLYLLRVLLDPRVTANLLSGLHCLLLLAQLRTVGCTQFIDPLCISVGHHQSACVGMAESVSHASNTAENG